MHADINPATTAIYDTIEFRRLANGRKRMRIALMTVSMAFFFSQPLLFSAFPALFKMHLTDSINVGLAWQVAQYAVGGLVAVLYAVCQTRFDRLAAALCANEAHAAIHADANADTDVVSTLRSA